MSTEQEHGILREYDDQKSRYEAFGRSVADLVSRLVARNGLDIFSVDYRVKDRSSLKAKIARPEKSGKYASLSDLTDITGVRVIAFLREDCRAICTLIEENFRIDYENSSDKELLLDPDRFGYTSIHYVVSHDYQRTFLPEFSDFDGLKAEIQIRTVLQHSWAAIDWSLRYKSNADVPLQLKRRLYRISALLEAADNEFSAISIEAKSIRADYRRQIEAQDFNIPIDAESVSIYFELSLPLKKLIARTHRSGMPILDVGKETHGRLPSLISALTAGGFSKLGEIDAVIRQPQKEHIANLKRVLASWKDRGGFEYLSIETMVRVLMTLSAGSSQAKRMIKGAPINFSLGKALETIVDNNVEPG